MPAHSRSKNGVLSHAYVAGIHAFFGDTVEKTWMASEVGLARLPHCLSVASRVNPAYDGEPGHDECKLARRAAYFHSIFFTS